MRGTVAPLAAATAAIALVCAGCADATPPAADPGSPAASYSRTGPWGEGDDALLQGTLALDDGCIVVVGPDGTVRTPVLPTDFRWDPGTETLSAFGVRLTVGEAVSLGGGGGADPSTLGGHVPGACSPSDEDGWFVVSSTA
ncbi:hypothetical protein [Xylanimonas sp. McL0601]|uniref:hypothetical protein n=1 Tax=Xylanimonas sp. McL0601 TaxID=3414739 RepID=UPI003CF270A9